MKTSISIALALVAALACAHGAAVAKQGVSLNPMVKPMVWPMPSIGGDFISEEIIGGTDADPAEFPHQVSMQVSMLWIVEQHICGGTILNEEWVLTAGHCVKGVPWYTSAFILAGKTNLGVKEAGQQRSAVKKMFTHEKFRGGVGPYDIGLLHLKTKLVLSDTIKPAKLPAQGAVPTGQATLSGWGSISTSQELVMPKQLQKLDLPIIPFDACNDAIQKLSDANGEKNPLVESSNVCVGHLDKAGQGACNGDSGGPLIQVVDGEVVVIGATSWGYFPCQAEAAPSVYTKVSAFVDWINENIAPAH
ncbi:trypsin-1-like [Thrips palmi]|uniref:Trypsin-1-like n=1 Tax=Thrips palmi TaxID=161013 RepID=A0A6P8Z307_THRPL|nr:trypsin-1-like [Thrips palmi]